MKNKVIWGVCVVIWITAVSAGLWKLTAYSSDPGEPASAPTSWPADSTLRLDRDHSTLVMTAHPQCPCTRASIGELASLMASSQGRLSAVVLFVRPEGFPNGWERSDLWESAKAIPGVTVTSDPAGVESNRFGAATSGQVVLYDSNGVLRFAGGITAARGHSGDNEGKSSILSALTDDDANRPNATPVFGCPLFNPGSKCRVENNE